jgi:hypothetical protein
LHIAELSDALLQLSTEVSHSGAAAGVDVGQDLLFGASTHAGEYRAVRLAASR